MPGSTWACSVSARTDRLRTTGSTTASNRLCSCILRSWNERPIAARRSKIEVALSNLNAFYFQPCTISAYTYLFGMERDIDGQRRQHLYVRHPRAEVIDPGAISGSSFSRIERDTRGRRGTFTRDSSCVTISASSRSRR